MVANPAAQAESPDPRDDPREFARIAVSRLVIDERKQREIDPEKIAKIANEWDWSRVEALTVCPRPDGFYDVVEGQHRTAGGRIYGGADLELPCMVLIPETTDKQQSQIALDIVQSRRGHSAYEQWRLRYNAGQPHEIYATTILEKYGLRVGKSPSVKTIGAVATVRRIIHGGQFTPEYGAELLDRTLNVLISAFPTHDHESNTGRWDRFIMLAVSQAVIRWPDVELDRLAQSLRTRPATQWTNLSKGVKPSPEMAILNGLVTEYNRHRRNGRLA